MLSPPLVRDGPASASRIVALAHGAGAPMDSPFMNAVAAGLAAAGIGVVRFEFPYMRARRETGVRRPPSRLPVLIEAWRAVVAALDEDRRKLVIGGKSLGGRVASMVADEVGAAGLLCLGYPFHAPGKPPGERIAHLATLRTPTLIVQGTRDPLGRPDEVASYPLAPAVTVAWIDDGDHSLAPRKASGRTADDALDEAIGLAAAFVRGL